MKKIIEFIMFYFVKVSKYCELVYINGGRTFQG